jgi:hypothetical protein
MEIFGWRADSWSDRAQRRSVPSDQGISEYRWAPVHLLRLSVGPHEAVVMSPGAYGSFLTSTTPDRRDEDPHQRHRYGVGCRPHVKGCVW